MALQGLRLSSLHAGYIYAFMSSADFSKFTFKMKGEYYQSVKLFGPDLGPNCLKRLSADDKHCAFKEMIRSTPGLALYM